ncbi:MAG: TlpA family protein disulfide reductase [Deltaproteobacteria bacterium]|nr:TlpA family protein disulfide reductase [Deltaproteobacteria bacterium]
MNEPRRRTRRLGSSVLGIALAAAGGWALTEGALGPRLAIGASAPKVGDPAPDVEVTDLAGKKVKLADLRGQAVFLNFWATWCPPCVEEMQSISNLAKSYQGKGLRVVAMNVDAAPAATIQQWVEKRKLGMEVLLDPNATIARRFGTYKFPETYLLDRDGKIQAKFVGPHEWNQPPFDAMLPALIGLGAPKPDAVAAPTAAPTSAPGGSP